MGFYSGASGGCTSSYGMSASNAPPSPRGPQRNPPPVSRQPPQPPRSTPSVQPGRGPQPPPERAVGGGALPPPMIPTVSHTSYQESSLLKRPAPLPPSRTKSSCSSPHFFDLLTDDLEQSIYYETSSQ